MKAVFIIEVSRRPSYRLKNFELERVNGKLFWVSKAVSLQITAKTYDEAVSIAKRYAIKTDRLFVDRYHGLTIDDFDPRSFISYLDGDLLDSEGSPSSLDQQIDAP